MAHLPDANRIQNLKASISKRHDTIPKHLRYLRKQHLYTLEMLSDNTGLSTSYLSCIEKGEEVPSVEALIKLHKVYSASIDFMIGRSDVVRRYPFGSKKEHLADLRKNKNCSQADIAVILEYKTAVPIYRQEKSGIKMKLDRIELLADYFNVPVDYIVGLTDVTVSKRHLVA